MPRLDRKPPPPPHPSPPSRCAGAVVRPGAAGVLQLDAGREVPARVQRVRGPGHVPQATRRQHLQLHLQGRRVSRAELRQHAHRLSCTREGRAVRSSVRQCDVHLCPQTIVRLLKGMCHFYSCVSLVLHGVIQVQPLPRLAARLHQPQGRCMVPDQDAEGPRPRYVAEHGHRRRAHRSMHLFY